MYGRNILSVIVNHYYGHDINEIITNRVSPVLEELRKELIYVLPPFGV